MGVTFTTVPQHFFSDDWVDGSQPRSVQDGIQDANVVGSNPVKQKHQTSTDRRTSISVKPGHYREMKATLCESLKEIAASSMLCDTRPDMCLADIWRAVQVQVI